MSRDDYNCNSAPLYRNGVDGGKVDSCKSSATEHQPERKAAIPPTFFEFARRSLNLKNPGASIRPSAIRLSSTALPAAGGKVEAPTAGLPAISALPPRPAFTSEPTRIAINTTSRKTPYDRPANNGTRHATFRGVPYITAPYFDNPYAMLCFLCERHMGHRAVDCWLRGRCRNCGSRDHAGAYCGNPTIYYKYQLPP